VGERAVDNVVLRLRRKLGADAGIIETVRGVGFRITDK
jgi:DNA-binding response OmpR family regulator